MASPLPPAEFSLWFSGFCDGEAHFSVLIDRRMKIKGGREYLHRGITTDFIIGLRNDDADLLRYIQTNLGCGSILLKQKRGASSPQARFKVTRLEECIYLGAFFQQYPLHGKKAREIPLWIEATDLRLQSHLVKGGGYKRGDKYYTDEMLHRGAEIEATLKEMRRYHEPTN